MSVAPVCMPLPQPPFLMSRGQATGHDFGGVPPSRRTWARGGGRVLAAGGSQVKNCHQAPQAPNP